MEYVELPATCVGDPMVSPEITPEQPKASTTPETESPPKLDPILTPTEVDPLPKPAEPNKKQKRKRPDSDDDIKYVKTVRHFNIV